MLCVARFVSQWRGVLDSLCVTEPRSPNKSILLYSLDEFPAGGIRRRNTIADRKRWLRILQLPWWHDPAWWCFQFRLRENKWNCVLYNFDTYEHWFLEHQQWTSKTRSDQLLFWRTLQINNNFGNGAHTNHTKTPNVVWNSLLLVFLSFQCVFVLLLHFVVSFCYFWH